MRELEFLPGWYPQLRRQKRWLRCQVWLSALLLSALGLWAAGAQRSVASAETSLGMLQSGLSETQVQLEKLDDMLEMQREWRHQDEVIARLGMHVEAARIVSSLEAVMPAEMSLLKLSVKIEDQRRGTPLAARRAREEGEAEENRRMAVRLTGVAPSDVDLANFIARLSNVPFYEDVSMTYLRQRTDSGHVMREFEVNFSLDLNGS